MRTASLAAVALLAALWGCRSGAPTTIEQPMAANKITTMSVVKDTTHDTLQIYTSIHKDTSRHVICRYQKIVRSVDNARHTDASKDTLIIYRTTPPDNNKATNSHEAYHISSILIALSFLGLLIWFIRARKP